MSHGAGYRLLPEGIGADQDVFVFYFVLGDRPKVPSDILTSEFFEVVRLKVAHFLDDKNVLECKDFSELQKPLRRYFTRFYPDCPAVKRKFR